MRHYGTLIRWNEQRAFGAILEDSMGIEVFAPQEAFTHAAPEEGLRVSFQLVKGRRGRDEALNIHPAADDAEEDFFPDDDFPVPEPKALAEPEPMPRGQLRVLLLIAAVAACMVGYFCLKPMLEAQRTPEPMPVMVKEVAEQMKAERRAMRNGALPQREAKPTSNTDSSISRWFSHSSTNSNSTKASHFKCDGRQYCSQMTSREEAEYFIQYCPNTKMDSDGDGHPCENDTRW